MSEAALLLIGAFVVGAAAVFLLRRRPVPAAAVAVLAGPAFLWVSHLTANRTSMWGNLGAAYGSGLWVAGALAGVLLALLLTRRRGRAGHAGR